MSLFPPDEPITVAPIKAFPVIRDLVSDVSFNYEVAKTIPCYDPLLWVLRKLTRKG